MDENNELEARKKRGDFVGDEAAVEEPEAEEPEAEEPEAEEPEAEEPEAEEPEAEEPEEPEAEEEEEPEPGARDDDAIMVPKGRLDEALQKARHREAELQRRLDAAEKRKQLETTSADIEGLETELDTLDSKYAELLLEGDLEKAREVRGQWRKKQNDLFDIRLEQRSSAASSHAVEQMRFDRQLAEYEVKHPAINPDSGDFSQEVADEVADLLGAFQAQGWNPVAALNKAVRYVLRDEAKAETPDPDVVKKKRQVQARNRVAEVARKSPPDIVDKGRDADKIGSGDGLPDVTRMSPDQFASLSDKQLRQLRGDFLADER